MQPRYLHYTDVMSVLYVTFDLALVSVLTFEHLSLGLGLGLACQGLGLGLEPLSLGLGLGLELLSRIQACY